MPQRPNTSVIKAMLRCLLVLLATTFSVTGLAVESNADVAINVALEAAHAHTPGKVVANEKADELVSMSPEEPKTLQPVYRIKILSQQGVMKTVFVHRHTGQVLE